MEKKIKLDSKTSLKVSNNVYWLVIYRNQFGRDIVPVLIPALNAMIDIGVNVYKATSGKGFKGIESIDADALKEALLEASGLEMVDILNVIWAMARAADDTVGDPEEFFRSFNTFPLDIIGPEIFELLFKGFISTKNLQRLQNQVESLKPESTSTNS